MLGEVRRCWLPCRPPMKGSAFDIILEYGSSAATAAVTPAVPVAAAVSPGKSKNTPLSRATAPPASPPVVVLWDVSALW